MPDLNHPKDQGTLMKPVFFATGQQLPMGESDLERREKLALWMTSRQRSLVCQGLRVDQMWSELVGHGFCEPVDDMGPDRQPLAPQAFEALAADFVASHYDVKWLLRTIVATTAYQRESQSRKDADQPALAASCPQRLRADQLFNVLCDALEIDEAAQMADGPKGKKAGDGPGRIFAGPRGQVNKVFGYDPSTRRDEISGSIPQALWMMNARELNRAVSAHSPDSMLAKLLAQQRDNKQVLLELYLRCLAREPKPSEVATCEEYLAEVHDRTIGFEDILWSLVNSTEFLERK